MSITKAQMTALMGEFFGYYPMFPMVFEQIFLRFRKAKCNVFSSQCAYFIRTITADDHVDVYELCMALTTFIKCEFRLKVALLFDLSDGDDDGFINEKELRKMISTLLVLFSNNTNSIRTNSTVLNQSLAYLDAISALNMLLSYPGELKQVFAKERYISFELFYERLMRIPGYKVKFLPLYVNFKDCLRTQPTETTIALKPDNLNEYLSISNEIIHPQASKGRSNDIRPQPEKPYIVKRTLAALKFKRDAERLRRPHAFARFREKALSNGNKSNSSDNCDRDENQLKEFKVSYLRIRNIEAKPGRFHLMGSRNCSLPNIMQRNCLKKRRNDYKNIEEIFNEINQLSNINKKEDYSTAEMNRIEVKVNEMGVNTRKLLKKREYSDSNLRFRSVKLMRLKV